MKKVLMIIGGIVVGITLLLLIIFGVVSYTSKKLKCTSNEANITLMYNDKTITGYTAKNISYDLDNQKIVAEQLGIEEYLDQFEEWFRTNTTGSCQR